MLMRQYSGLIATSASVRFEENYVKRFFMKSVSILVTEYAVPACVTDTYDIFSVANRFLEESGRKPFFELKVVGLTRKVRLANGLVQINSEALINEIQHTDIVIIPALTGEINDALQANRMFIPWLTDRYHKGAELVSLCIGSFLLAKTGLLNGMDCATHWKYENEFKKMFPKLRVLGGKVVTEQNGLYTSGGANTYWNLLLYLVERHTSRDIALKACRYFLIDTGKNSQLPFTVFNGQKEHADKTVLQAQQLLEKDYASAFTVEELARRFSLGRRTFERRFKIATSTTVITYLQRIRIEIAKRHLEDEKKTIREIMYEVGYNNAKAFRGIFKKHAGVLPIVYRNKFGKGSS